MTNLRPSSFVIRLFTRKPYEKKAFSFPINIMNAVYVFLIHNNEWIYIVGALGIFWFASQFLRARGNLKRAVFGLERERGRAQRNTALAFIGLFLAVIGIVFFINVRIAPTLPPELLKPFTPTPNIFRTPLSSPTPLGQEIERPPATPELVPTITLASQPGATSQPIAATPQPNETPEILETAPPTFAGPTPTPFVGCTVPLNITDPSNGSFVAGSISFFGTVNTDNFGFYRLEANGPQTNGSWASLLGRDVDNLVRDGLLGNVNLSEWGNGPYLIKLSAFDIAENLTGECIIQVTLNN